jgi:predicted permease
MRLSLTTFSDALVVVVLSVVFAVCFLFWRLCAPFYFDPTPGLDGGRIVSFRQYDPHSGGDVLFSRNELNALQRFPQVLDGTAAFALRSAGLSDSQGLPAEATAADVSPDFFRVFGVDFAGRSLFSHGHGAENLAVVSFSCWQRLYRSRRDIVGSIVTVNGKPVQVAGILPKDVHWPGYLFPADPDIFLLWNDVPEAQAGQLSYGLVGRLAPGSSTAAASTALQAVLDNERSPYVHGTVEAKTLDMRARQTGRWLFVLLGCGVVLLVGVSLNIAVLLLGRTIQTINGWIVRKALGAGTARLIAALLGQFLPVSLLASGLGVALAFVLRELVLSDTSTVIPMAAGDNPIAAAAGFAVLLVLGSSAVCLAGPLLAIKRQDVASLLRSVPSESVGARKLSRFLILAQIGITACLVVVAAPVIEQYQKKDLLDLGFNYKNLWVVELDRVPWQTGAGAGIGEDLAIVERRLRSNPDVQAVAAANMISFLAPGSATVKVVGRGSANPDQEVRIAQARISPEYFQTLQMPLEGHPPRAPDEVVVSRSFAHRFWDGAAIGRRFAIGPTEYTITGVVAADRMNDLSGSGLPAIYYSLEDASTCATCALEDASRWPSLVMRSGLPAATVASVVKAALSPLDAPPLFRIHSMEALRANELAVPRLLAEIFVFLAGLLVVVSFVGVFAGVSCDMNRRRHETAIRVALGARRTRIVRQRLAELSWVVVPGVAVGGIAGYYLLQGAHELLEVQSVEFSSVAIGMAAVLIVAGLAALIPTWKGSGGNPAAVLKSI